MNSQLFIPTKIKVGYQERSDTYSDLLGYVIYYDEKGKLRKEPSWRGWIDKGVPPGTTTWEWDEKGKSMQVPVEPRDPLPTHDYDNKPLEGFVLNRDIGGKGSGWSSWHDRQTKIRVWDPRGFEFEITLDNLLFILQECNSIKGKGLEGEFVYAWEGKDIMLLPVTSQEYQNSLKFTELKSKKVTARQLVPGYTYETKRQEKLIYLGKFDCLTGESDYYFNIGLGNFFVFIDEDGENLLKDKINDIAVVVSDTVIGTFAELIDNFKNCDESTYVKGLVETKMHYDRASNEGYYYGSVEDRCILYETPCIKDAEGEYTQYGLYPVIKTESTGDYWNRTKKYFTEGFRIEPIRKIFYKDGMLSEQRITNKTKVEDRLITSLAETNKMKFVTLEIQRKKKDKTYKLRP
jgi:hypothetical protein